MNNSFFSMNEWLSLVFKYFCRKNEIICDGWLTLIESFFMQSCVCVCVCQLKYRFVFVGMTCGAGRFSAERIKCFVQITEFEQLSISNSPLNWIPTAIPTDTRIQNWHANVSFQLQSLLCWMLALLYSFRLNTVVYRINLFAPAAIVFVITRCVCWYNNQEFRKNTSSLVK